MLSEEKWEGAKEEGVAVVIALENPCPNKYLNSLHGTRQRVSIDKTLYTFALLRIANLSMNLHSSSKYHGHIHNKYYHWYYFTRGCIKCSIILGFSIYFTFVGHFFIKSFTYVS